MGLAVQHQVQMVAMVSPLLLEHLQHGQEVAVAKAELVSEAQGLESASAVEVKTEPVAEEIVTEQTLIRVIADSQLLDNRVD